MGNCFQLPEPDLSHLLYQDNTRFNDVGIALDIGVRKKSEYTIHSAVLLWALLVSLIIHTILLSLDFTFVEVQSVSTPPKPIYIELQRIVPTPVLQPKVVVPDVIESPIERPRIIEPALVESVLITPIDGHGNTNKKTKSDDQGIQEDNAKQSAFIPITPDELQSLQDQPTYSLEPSDADLKEVNAKPFGGVFDPRLRKKLQDQQAEKQAKALGISTYELANGSTVVKLSDNHCLSTLSQGKKENETNWYHTGCHEKTEGERMMDRVNESMRLKRK